MAQECRYCGTEQTEEGTGQAYPPYTYDEWVCDDCWNNCPECGNDEWNRKTSHNARSDDEKTCTNCGFSFIINPASG